MMRLECVMLAKKSIAKRLHSHETSFIKQTQNEEDKELKKKMKITLVILVILCATIVQTSEKPEKWPTTFKKIGQLVIGNSYGHIHTVVDVNLMRQTIMHAIKTVEINKKRNYYTAESFELLKKQLLPYIGILDRIESGFFRDDVNEMVEPVRIKRQAGLGLGLGVMSMGVST